MCLIRLSNSCINLVLFYKQIVTLSDRVAVKIIEKGKHGCGTTLKMLRQEVSTMEKLDHPNIISLYEEIETLDKFYCVMEYVDGEAQL